LHSPGFLLLLELLLDHVQGGSDLLLYSLELVYLVWTSKKISKFCQNLILMFLFIFELWCGLLIFYHNVCVFYVDYRWLSWLRWLLQRHHFSLERFEEKKFFKIYFYIWVDICDVVFKYFVHNVEDYFVKT